METKICTQCGRELPLENFHQRNRKKRTYRSECKNCHNKYVSKRNETNRKAINELKKQQHCAKCGENRFYLLDYHHVNPEEKENTIARMMTHYSIKDTLEEIDKCIVLCANCHREFHWLEKELGITLDKYLS